MNRTDKFQDISDIADAVCNEDVSAEQLQQLEHLLVNNEAGQQFYFDYISMHMHLSAEIAPNVEFVYRKTSEEFIVRPVDNAPIIDISETHAPFDENNENNQKLHLTQAGPDNDSLNKKMIAITTTLICLLLLVMSWFILNKTKDNYTAEILQGHLSTTEHGDVDSRYLHSGEYQVEKDSILRLHSGDTLQLTENSIVKLLNTNEIQLKQGIVSLKPVSNNNIIVHGPSFSLYSNSQPLTVDLISERPLVTTSDNTELKPHRWRPTHYWTFDSEHELVIDSASNAYGNPAAGATRTKGLVGKGAFNFDNSASARIDVGTGGGTAPATGSFAVTDGVTIEALIRPDYSGKIKEIDEIFRKGQLDGELRMLLSFQNDKGKDYLKPKGDVNESLSFGLYVVGQGYHELKLPLDGLNGRPRLADLKTGDFHHIVATYNVMTGIKSIYIDGEQLAFYQYPPGSKMLSGGPGEAAIGNNPSHTRWHQEAFAGVIDEVAFYDFALPPLTIKQHFEQGKQGVNYFGLSPSVDSLPEQIKIVLPPYKTLALDPLTGLPYEVIDQAPSN